MNIKNFKIGTRLGLAFCVVILFTIISSAVGLSSLVSVGHKWSDFSSVSLEKRRLANNGNAALGDAVHHFKDYVLRGREYNKSFTLDIAAITADVEAYQKLDHLSSEEKSLLDGVRKGADKYTEAMNKAVQMKLAGKSIEEIDQSIAGADKDVAKAWNDILTIVREEATTTGKSIGQTVDSSERITFILSALVIILSAMCAYLVTRSITRPIAQALKVAQKVAEGDLTHEIIVTSSDEMGQLLLALQAMTLSLQNIVSQVRNGTETIAAATGQIASGNLDLSSRTEEQAASLEETAASLEEITSTVKQSADNSRHASQLAVRASETALMGGKVVSEVVHTMGEINTSSSKIADIISVIDGIAFQTNILALNAAVEAARAGEQGRGFAVVASEVRNLAQRSASAAKEIKVLITESVEKVSTGSELVNQAGVTMDEVVASVQRVSDVINDITAANQEQSTGIDQINQAVSQMDEVTQQNAALVEEAAAAANSLQNQAETLLDAVRIFKLPEQNGASRAVVKSGRPNAVIRPISLSRKSRPIAKRLDPLAKAL